MILLLPVSKESLEVDDELLLLLCEVATLDSGPEASKEELTGLCRSSLPVARSMLLDVGDQHEVLFWRPRTLLHTYLITARRSSHFIRSDLL
ncbi:hypothetical protein BHE74_00056632 [Ensete ventricosum]|nr:hypothetical protein BHE74_00056632 [Ensete ventricosum]